MKARVASVHFAALHAERPMFSSQRSFHFVGVPLDAAPAIIEIDDQRQVERGPYMSSSDRKQRSLHKYIIDGLDIARDIVYQWAHNGLGMIEGQRPGVWVVRDVIPEIGEGGVQMTDADGKGLFREATTKEREEMFREDLAAARKADVEYGRWCVMEGNTIAQDIRRIQFIPERYKLAAKHLGMDTAWVKPTSAALEMKTCPLCTEVIPAKAIVCRKCTQVIDGAGMKIFEEKMLAEAKKGQKAG